MIVGYNLTRDGRDFFRMIGDAVEDQGEATATLLTLLHGRGMFEPVEFSAAEMNEHINGLIAGKVRPFDCEFETRDLREVIRNVAAKMRCDVTFNYEAQTARFVTNNRYLNQDWFEVPAMPDLSPDPTGIPSEWASVSARAIRFKRLWPNAVFSCQECGDVVPASVRRLSKHAETHVQQS